MSYNIQKVYKVIQRVGKYNYSVNPNFHASAIKNSGKTVKGVSRVIQYKIGQIVRPLEGDDVIFVVHTLEDAQKACKFYSDSDSDLGSNLIKIMEGYAGNPMTFNESTIKYRNCEYFVPSDFYTTLCDWFIPTRFVNTFKT